MATDGPPPAPAHTKPLPADLEQRRRDERPNWGLGLIDFRNEYLLSLTYLTLAPDSPAVLEQGVFQLAVRGDIANTMTDNFDTGSRIDGETIDVAPIVRIGVLPKLQLSAELPIVYRWAGVLDSMIVETERGFGELRRERRDLPAYDYRVRGMSDDGEPFELEEGVGVGKLRVGLKAQLPGPKPPWPTFAIEGVAALPTATEGFGTQGVDLGLRLSGAKRFGDFVVYFGGAITVPARDLGPLELKRPVYMGFVGFEYEIEPWLAFIYQGWAESGPFDDLGGGSPIVYHGGGLKAFFNGLFGEAGILQNGGDVTRSADVTFHGAVGVTF